MPEGRRVGSGYVDVEPDLTGFQRKLQAGVGASLQKVGRGLTTLGKGLTAAVTLPLAAIGVGAVKAAVAFESSFAGVRKTVDATEEQFAALARGFRDMAKEIPVNVNELNRIGELGGQLGIATDNLLKFTRVIADLGVTTDLAIDDAALSLSQFMNVMGTAQGDIDRIGATIVDLGNNFATTESKIVEFGQRLAGAGKIAGLTEANVLAIGAAMASVGVEAEAGGTATQKVLLSLTEAVATGNENLAVFAKTAGQTAKDFAATWKADPAEAFTQFVEGLGKAGQDAFQILDDLGLTDQRLIRGFLSLAGAGDLLRRSIEQGSVAWEENTALTEEARKRYETFESKMAIFKNRVSDVGITLGTALLPILLRLVDAVDPIVQKIASLAEKFAALPEPVQTTVLLIAAAAAAMGPLLLIVGTLMTGLGGLLPVLAPIGLGIAGIGAAIVGAVLLFQTHWPKIKEIAEDVWRDAQPILANLNDAFLTIADAVRDRWPDIQRKALEVIDIIKQVWGNVGPVLTDLSEMVKQLAEDFGPLIGAVASFSASLAVGAIRSFADAIRSIARALQAVIDAWRGMPGWAKTLLETGASVAIPGIAAVRGAAAASRSPISPSSGARPGSGRRGSDVYHEGGIVTRRFHAGGYMPPRLASDEVLGILQTDEFVIPRGGLTVEVPLSIDGRAFARATRKYTAQELEALRRARV